jgi:hypothetical protein
MKFRALIRNGEKEEWQEYDLDLRPATKDSARTYLVATIDEENRKFRNKRLELLDVQLAAPARRAATG